MLTFMLVIAGLLILTTLAVIIKSRRSKKTQLPELNRQVAFDISRIKKVAMTGASIEQIERYARKNCVHWKTLPIQQIVRSVRRGEK